MDDKCIVCNRSNNTTQKVNNSYFPNSHFSKGICSDDCFSNYINYNILVKNSHKLIRDDGLVSIGNDFSIGVKFDTNKIRWDLLPVEALEEVAKVFTFGANKYNERNWEKGLEYNRLYRAALHHLTDFWMGKTNDEESNLHSLAHCAFNVLALLHFEITNINKKDNRPKIKD